MLAYQQFSKMQQPRRMLFNARGRKLNSLSDKSLSYRSFSGSPTAFNSSKITTHFGKNCAPPREGVPYSPAAKANGLVWVSGQVAVDPTGKYLPSELSTTEKSHRMMLNLKGSLESAGSSLDKVVKANVIFTDIDRDYESFNAVYGEYIKHRPARTSFEVSGLPKPADIEIEAVALA